MKQEILPLPSMMVSNDAPSIDRWIQWTHALCFVDGIALSIYSKTKSDVVKKALKSLHIALKGVDDEFIKVIEALKKDPPVIPDVPINPSPIIPWEDPSFFDGILEIVRAALAEALTIISKYASEALQLLIHAVGALINCIEDIIEIFKAHKNEI